MRERERERSSSFLIISGVALAEDRVELGLNAWEERFILALIEAESCCPFFFFWGGGVPVKTFAGSYNH